MKAAILMLLTALLNQVSSIAAVLLPPEYLVKAPGDSTCGLYEEHRTCGPMCPPTCDTLKDTICCPVACVSDCFCADGYMLLSKGGPKKCVLIAECPRPGILKFEERSLAALERENVIRIVVIRINGSYGEVRISWRIVFKNTYSYPEYEGRSGELVFPDGVVRQVIEIPIVDNDVRGPDITFRVELYNPTNKVELAEDEPFSELTIKDDDMKPGYFELEKTSYVVSESVGTLEIAVLRVGGTDGQIRVRYKTQVKSAEAVFDFTPVEGELVFEEGESRKTIQIDILDDKRREPSKSFEILFLDPAPGPGVINFRNHGFKESVVVTITDDDMAPGYLEFEKGDYVITESVRNLGIGVVRLGGSDGQIQVNFKSVVKTALIDTDFLPVEGVLVFEEGETLKNINIRIIDDDIREPAKSFEVQLYDPAPGADVINFRGLGSTVSALVTINDDDMRPGYLEFEYPNYSAKENDQSQIIYVKRYGGTDGDLRVNYKTVSSTAVAGKDFMSLEGELFFREGEDTQQITIPIINNDIREADRTFELELFDPTPGIGVINFRGLGRRLRTEVKIIDDDMRPGIFELEQSTYTVSESVGVLKVTVLRVDGTDGQIRVRYRTVSRTALPSVDFLPIEGELLFDEGVVQKCIEIQIINNDVTNPAKTFEIQLLDPTPGDGVINFRGLGDTTASLVTITDDDMRPGFLQMEKATVSVSESIGIVHVGVIRVDGSDGQIRVKYRVVPVTSQLKLDFMFIPGELVFNNGVTRKTIPITIINDNIREPIESFRVELYEPSISSAIFFRNHESSTLTTEVVIIDDDERPGYVEMKQPLLTVQEDVGIVEVLVLRLDGADGQLRVKYATVEGKATAPKDFTSTSGELVFEENETQKVISVAIVDDDEKEKTEDFQIRLLDVVASISVRNFNPFGLNLQTTITIVDNDITRGVIVMEQERIAVPEDVGAVQVFIVRTGGTDGNLSVRFQTKDGTAKAGADYVRVEGEILFADGEVRKVIFVPIINDNAKEPEKSFSLELFSPLARSLGSLTEVLITINDDDKTFGLFQFVYSRITVSEDRGKLTLTIVRRGGSDGSVTLQWRTKDRSTVSGQDYRPLQGSVLFEEGEVEKTITIDIIDDSDRENDEEFLIGLFSPTNGGVLGPINTVVVTIRDNDESREIKQEENIEIFFVRTLIRIKRSIGKVRVNIRRTGELVPITIFMTTKDGSAKGGVDYRRTRGNITFFQNEIELTIELRLIRNNQLGTDSFFLVEISRPSKGIIRPTSNVATVVIENDSSEDISGRGGESEAAQGVYSGQTLSVSGSYRMRSDISGGLSLPYPEIPTVQHQVPQFIPKQPPPGTDQVIKQNCPPGMTFKLCAPTCPKTCQTMNDPEHCQKKCINACFCEDGYVIENLDTLKCILPTDCTGFRSLGTIAAAATGLLGGIGLGGLLPTG